MNPRKFSMSVAVPGLFLLCVALAPVVGFTKDKYGSSPNAETWSAAPSDNDCTINRRQLQFSYNVHAMAGNPVTWRLGPPSDTNAPVRGNGGETSFLAILAHEMGHTIGLGDPAGTSKSVGHVYRLPSELDEGRTYRVFVRALPSDPRTGSSLWHTDADTWNNAIMLPSTITVTRSACS